MKKRLAMLFALCLMTGVLSSCGKDTSSTETTKKDDNTLVILNYGKYIDESVLDQFEKETGIKVKLEEYESPEEMYTKFSAGSINYDLVCTSDYMVERLINEDQVLEINFDDFEYYKNLDSSIIEASQIFDPENKYSMPYFTVRSVSSTTRRWYPTRKYPPGTFSGMKHTKTRSSCRTLSATALPRH